MKTPCLIVSLALCCLVGTARAQSSSPVSDALRTMAKRSSANLIAAAEEIPADKLDFKPTPAQMSFGDVLAHLTEGNDFLCSTVSGSPAPKRSEIKADAGKDKLVARLRETFGYCESALAKVTDARLSRKVPWFGNHQITRAGAILATAQDWADHYSQLAIYLRLNGLLPPTAKQKEE